MAKRLFEQGADVDPIGTNRVAHGKSGTATSNSTWDKIVIWLRTALSSVTTRFVTDTQISTWNAKMEDTKAAIEAKLTGEITSHTHPTSLLNYAIVNIGDWDMVTNGTRTIAHGQDRTKIRRATAYILADSGSPVDAPLDSFNDVGDYTNGGITSITSTNITLGRHSTGLFNNSNYNATSFNRGYIVFELIP